MSIIVSGHRYACRVGCTNNEQASLNTMVMVATAVTGNPTTAAAAATIAAAMAGLYKNMLSANSTYDGASVQDLDQSPKLSADISTTGNGVGALAAPDLPRQTCGVASFRTGFTGRANRGRMYLPFPAASLNTQQGVPTAAGLLIMQQIVSAWVAGFTVGVIPNTAVLLPAIFHRRTNTHTFVTAGGIVLKWGTQRRRGSYGRANVDPI